MLSIYAIEGACLASLALITILALDTYTLLVRVPAKKRESEDED